MAGDARFDKRIRCNGAPEKPNPSFGPMSTAGLVAKGLPLLPVDV
jgi:hypothetical protein